MTHEAVEPLLALASDDAASLAPTHRPSFPRTQPASRALPVKALKAAATSWFLLAVVGQWIFASYVFVFYGGAAARADLSEWNQVLAYGYASGDALGNAVLAVHLLLAVIVTVGGPLQLVPQIRGRAPTFHRWNGRIYLTAALVIGLTGLFRLWARGAVGDIWQHIAISGNTALILIFGALALRYALARDFTTHRRWALRLFLAMSGVWFFRVGLMLWLVVNQGPVGFDMKTFQGPFLTALAFGQYLLPLAVLECYLRARDRGSDTTRWVVAGSLFVLTAAMGVGIFAAAMGMWLPRI